MRVFITLDPKDPFRDEVRGDAEFWLGNRARHGWRVREKEDPTARGAGLRVDDPSDAIGFHMRAETAERRGRLD
jgi:hypothetical protein